MEREGNPSSENVLQVQVTNRGKAPIVPQPQSTSGEFVSPPQQVASAEVFTTQHSVREYQGQQESVTPPRRRAGSPQKPTEHAPSGEMYRGSLIRQLRKARGLDTKTVSAQLGYHHPRALKLIEGNRQNLSTTKLDELAKLLDVPVSELQQAPVHPRISRKGSIEKPTEHAPSGEMYRGSLIRQLREARGLQMKELEARLGYSSLSVIETNRGNLSQEKLHKLAELLDVPVTELEQAPVYPLAAARKKAKGQLKH
jgi:transcriptional regulator with XRE-family HTH domain